MSPVIVDRFPPPVSNGFNSFQFLCLWSPRLVAYPKKRIWLWSYEIDEMFRPILKNLGQIQCAKVLQRLYLNQSFFNTIMWGVIAPSPYIFISRQSHLPHPRQTSLEQRKEGDIQPQISKNYTPGTGISRFILPLVWTSDEKSHAWNHGK